VVGELDIVLSTKHGLTMPGMVLMLSLKKYAVPRLLDIASPVRIQTRLRQSFVEKNFDAGEVNPKNVGV
jgi:hypothetical protein